MNLKEQEYVYTLAQCGSITKAAKQLFISQPALSAYINNLEKSLGVDLFSREGKQMRPTYAGELYVKKAEQMLVLQKDYLQEVTDIIHGIQGRVVIGMQRRRGTTLVVETIKRFQGLFPHIDLEFFLENSEMMSKKYLEGFIDVVLLNEKIDNAYTVNELLVREKVLLTCSRKDPIVKKSVYRNDSDYRWLDLKEIENHTIFLPAIGQSLRKDCDVVFKENSVAPKRIKELGHIDTCMQVAAEGFGVCFTRESYATQFRYVKQPVFLAVGMPVFEKPLYAIYRNDEKDIPYLSGVVSILRQVVEDVITKRID